MDVVCTGSTGSGVFWETGLKYTQNRDFVCQIAKIKNKRTSKQPQTHMLFAQTSLQSESCGTQVRSVARERGRRANSETAICVSDTRLADRLCTLSPLVGIVTLLMAVPLRFRHVALGDQAQAR